MVKRLLVLALVAFLLFQGCILNKEGPYGKESDTHKANLEQESRYTLSQSIYLDEKLVGYLLTFLEVPEGSSATQHYKPGFRYIKDFDFKNLGYILPLGKTYRYDDRNIGVEVCQWDLEKNLAYFFGNPSGKVKLRDLGK